MYALSLRCGMVLCILAILSLVMPLSAKADPCGMVPPIATDGDLVQIKRVGPQKTYVFYDEGIETFIIRPAYEGRIDEFGMLIPFPVPPAITKAPDNVFEQIAAGIDPPEVVVDLRPPPTPSAPAMFGGGLGGGAFGGGGLGFAMPKDHVEVVREEAVGMYEVAVLAAGSAKALKRWLDEHHYKFPFGMDEPCNEYVRHGWCFVAVKTRVAQRGASDPQPGQRKIESALPEGAVFDGHVQAMQFRFPSQELMVPMRLSAFNAGETRNVVYLLANKPAKIRNIPEEYVVRQISGEQLYANLTQLLPLRIIGGDLDDIPVKRLKALAPQRDPKPHNGVAAETFAADLLAAKTGQLLAAHEVQEKELLAINERLSLRAHGIDEVVSEALAGEKAKTVGLALREIKKMSLTIVDGEFPREVLARQNLTFAEHRMPLRRSTRQAYDANLLGPGTKKEGVLRSGSLDELRMQCASRIALHEEPSSVAPQRHVLLGLIGLVGLMLLCSPAIRRWTGNA